MRRHVLCLVALATAVSAAIAALGSGTAAADTIKVGGNVINETWTAAGALPCT